MITKWFPWKWLIGRAVRSYGLIDPFSILARLRKFAEPSEVDAPLELIRAWTVFQARGIVNTRAIQHNLDWVWPYWVERQFNPRDISFVPRSFSLAHINLTHRNWTAVCLPDADHFSLVDPRGLITPLHDGWSLDAWIIGARQHLIPSRCGDAQQTLHGRDTLAVETSVHAEGSRLSSQVVMERNSQQVPELRIAWQAEVNEPAKLCISLRHYNPEGIQFIDTIKTLDHPCGWLVNNNTHVLFHPRPDRFFASTYKAGDVYHRTHDPAVGRDTECPVGMATAAAVFPIAPDGPNRVSVTVPLDRKTTARPVKTRSYRPRTTWKALEEIGPVLEIPDERMKYIYQAAVRTLLSLSGGDIYPGSYTYRRFWYRDACLMLNALLTLNHDECCRRSLAGSFIQRQTVRGFYQSQQGEWDSNGQVLWLAGRCQALTGNAPAPDVLKSLRKGADWLCRKRLPRGSAPENSGLLPAGFSAEHFGPNNYYYWDNFWGVAGLRSASRIFRQTGDAAYAERLAAIAEEYMECIEASIMRIPRTRCGGAIPAAPERRMDAGAIGALVADYPLALYKPGHPGIRKTVEFLLEHCMMDHGFFQDMTHSGINPYLTLHLAQVLLRAGDERFMPLVRRIAELASPTGQWPEAVHPVTLGGCMGDGQHGWAAAEWVLMIRSLFLREEQDRLVIGAGLFPEWLSSGARLRFGPTSTAFGRVTVEIDTDREEPRVTLRARWFDQAPETVNAIPLHQNRPVEIVQENRKPPRRT
jgi:hypothetical protein